MKLLLSLSALWAAACAALVFPAMKNLLLLVPFALVLLGGAACSSVTANLRKLPDGHFEGLELNETGKFTNTTGKFAVLDKDNGVIRARGVDLRHNNPWMPNVSLKSDVAVIALDPAVAQRPNPPAIPLPTETAHADASATANANASPVAAAPAMTATALSAPAATTTTASTAPTVTIFPAASVATTHTTAPIDDASPPAR